MEKKEHSYTVDGSENWYQFGGPIWRFCKKLKVRATMWPSITTLGLISGENANSKRYVHPSVHCSTVYNRQDMEAPKFLSTDEWIKKMGQLHTIEY